uniref:Uncharacterized protein n=1 Tax=Opuntia streptacantha TaxID=393608 RepID=A0A7C8YWT7_OPUST
MGRRIFVFIVGGATRSELQACHKLTTKLKREVILGSSSIDDPAQFIMVWIGFRFLGSSNRLSSPLGGRLVLVLTASPLLLLLLQKLKLLSASELSLDDVGT